MNRPDAGQPARPEPLRPLPERLLRRILSLLFWASVLVLGAFGISFSFANHPWYASGVVLVILLVIGIRSGGDIRGRGRRRVRDGGH